MNGDVGAQQAQFFASDPCADQVRQVACDILLGRAGTWTDADRAVADTGNANYSYYEFLFPTTNAWAERPELSDGALALLDALEASGFDTQPFYDFLTAVETAITTAVLFSGLAPTTARLIIDELLDELYDTSNDTRLVSLFRTYVILPDGTLGYVPGDPAAFPSMGLPNAYHFQRQLYLSTLWYFEYSYPVSDQWQWPNDFWQFVEQELTYQSERPSENSRERLAFGHDFEVFYPGSVNIGLRHVYRQSWVPVYSQPGEIVRTIPLGPGEKRRISTKLTARRKTAQSMDTLQASESTTETSDTTKSSNDIIREISSSSNWKAEAQGSFDLGPVSLGGGGGGGREQSQRSQSTITRLNESAAKSASKLRQETKLSVLTEGEEGFEQSTAAEIHNPNDEVAVTYEYRRLQYQYEIQSALTEVDTVVFVAERVPDRSEIDAQWVRRHDWMLARDLLDESFRSILSEITEDPEEHTPFVDTENPLTEIAKAAADNFAKFNAGEQMVSAGLSDIYSGPVNEYRSWLQEQMAQSRANEQRNNRRERLYEHIRENILHYCRTIWTLEDPDQRILRYKKMRLSIPTRWTFDGTRYTPASEPLNPRPLPIYDLIDVSGPLGFFGNYAIYRLRYLDDPLDLKDKQYGLLSLNEVLDQFRGRYTDDGENLVDPALEIYLDGAQQQLSLDPNTAEDVAHYLPELRDTLFGADGNLLIDDAGNLQNPVSATDWARYLYKMNSTDRVLIDTGSLHLRLTVGEESIIEPFKKVHRYSDALAAYSEYEREVIVNAKRQTHLNDPRAYDPDIQKVVITGDDSLSDEATAHSGLTDVTDDGSTGT